MTTSVLAPPSLTCPPRIRHVSDHVRPDWGDLAIDFCDTYVAEPGKPSYDWQNDILRCWMSTEPNGDYTHTTCGEDIPRQNGKTKRTCVPRMLVGAIFKGEQIRYSSHRVDVMLEIFDLCVDILGDPRKPEDEWRPTAKELNDYCRPHINFTNGHQKIVFSTPDGKHGMIRFVSRARDAGRGSTVDVNVFDEAQALTDQQIAAALPAQSAAPNGHPQTIYVGTPPNTEKEETGEVFNRVRESGLRGDEGVCWHEWSVDEYPETNMGDHSLWFSVNPSLGKSLLVAAVEKEFREMTPMRFAIERLCYWPPTASAKAIDGSKWDATISDGPEASDVVKKAMGVKFDPDGIQVCAALAILDNDGNTHCELVYEGNNINGIQDLEDIIFNAREELAVIVIDGRTGSGEMYERLIRRKDSRGREAIETTQVHLMKTQEVPTAATMVVNGLAERTLTHKADQTLDASAKGAVRRKVGTDGYGFGNDSCAIEAMAAANWGVRTTKREAGKRKWAHGRQINFC